MDHLLFVDDDTHILHINRKYFESWGYAVNTAASAAEAFDALLRCSINASF